MSGLVQSWSGDHIHHPALVTLALNQDHIFKCASISFVRLNNNNYVPRCVLYLTRYQEVQEAAREEVESSWLPS